MFRPSECCAGALAASPAPRSTTAVPIETARHQAPRAVHCNECCMQHLCLGSDTDATDVAQFETLIDHWHPMPKEKYIAREGDAFDGVFLVRSGSVKTCQTLANGEEHITGFHFPGEIFGLDGLSSNAHVNSAITMETTSLCLLPVRSMLSIRKAAPTIEIRFLLLVSELLTRKDEHSSMLSKNRAHERLAAFLLDLSCRFERRHLSSLCFSLPMSRTDVSRYLGLSLESVSRAFALLEKNRLIKSTGRVLEIVDKTALAFLAGVSQESQRDTAKPRNCITA